MNTLVLSKGVKINGADVALMDTDTAAKILVSCDDTITNLIKPAGLFTDHQNIIYYYVYITHSVY